MILKTCVQTFHQMTRVLQVIKTLNPKAVELLQVFGHYDVSSSKWIEGILSTLWRKAAQGDAIRHWIVLDGPVDFEWMENLNSALDDTEELTLANGDRLPLPSTLKIVLETDHLQHASPAVVSRIGIVFVSSATLGYEPMVSAWLKSRPEAQGLLLKDIFEKIFSTIVNTAARILKTVMEVPGIVLVQNMLHILESLLSRGRGSENGDQSNLVLEKMVIFAICWSFGGPVEAEGRTRLEAEVKKLLPKGYPASDLGRPSESYLDDKGEWCPISPEDLSFEFSLDVEYFDIYVPTSHDALYRKLLGLLVPRKHTVLILGGIGCGKSSMIAEFMKDRAHKDGLTTKKIVLSVDTTPSGLQREIESATEKRQGRIFGPSNYRTGTVFIDDVNLPNTSKWGDQPAIELFRHLMSDGGFFNLDKLGEWKRIEDLEFVTAMTHPGGGRNDLPTRLKRKLQLINMTALPRDAVQQIYTRMVSGYFSDKNVGSDTAAVAAKLAEPTLHIWKSLQERITPTATNFHYKYTLRDLSNVFRGMMRCHKDLFDGKDYVAKLWKHECERAFTDKLNSPADKSMVTSLIQETMDEALGKLAAKCQGTIYFCTFMQEDEDKLLADGEVDPDALNHPYEVCQSFNDMQNKVTKLLDKFNADPEQRVKMDLVLFQYVVEHLLRILRAICLDGGSCLLIGLKATGKQCLATLAAYILEHEFLRARFSHTRDSLLEDLKRHCKYAALENKHVTLLVAEADVSDERIWDLVNQMIFTGEIVDMFSKEEMNQLVGEASFRAEVQRNTPEWSESTESLTKFFFRRVRRNFHCISTVR